MLQKLNLYAYFLPKMNSCRRDFDKTKCISFLIKDENLGKNQQHYQQVQLQWTPGV